MSTLSAEPAGFTSTWSDQDSKEAEIFAQAQKLGEKLPFLKASPNLINGSCTTTPVCRHCKWEGIKLHDAAWTRLRSKEEFLERGAWLSDLGIDRIFIPSGWMGLEVPPLYLEYIRELRKVVRCEIWGLMGALSETSLARLHEAGMDGFICGFESPNETIYRSFRPGGDSLAQRLDCLAACRKVGLKIWTGFLVGLGESGEDQARGLRMIQDIGPDSISLLPFVPVPGSAMEKWAPAHPRDWALALARARLLMPSCNIFSDQPSGFMEPFGRLAGVNGLYVFPQRNPL